MLVPVGLVHSLTNIRPNAPEPACPTGQSWTGRDLLQPRTSWEPLFKPPISRLSSCLLGHWRLIHLTSPWFTICSSWPWHPPPGAGALFLQYQQGNDSKQLVTFRPCILSASSAGSSPSPFLSVPIQHPHTQGCSFKEPMGSYPRYRHKERAGWDWANGNSLVCSKGPKLCPGYKIRGSIAESTRSGTLCLIS